MVSSDVMCHHWRRFQVKESVIPDKLSLRACWLIFINNKWTEPVVKFKFMRDVHLPDLNDFQ